MTRIYLDHAATTPLLPQAREAMLPWLTGEYGNPSSLHADGRRAKDAIDEAREILSNRLDCLFAEVLFTSGGTEAANLAIVGSALANENPTRNRILLGAAEHHCVLHTQPLLERLGYKVELIPVDRIARTDLNALESRLADDVLLVSVMHANNELGTIQPVGEIAALARRHGALFHCDAVQTFMKVDWRIGDLDADLVTLSSHKINGPKAVGAIYIRAGVKLKPLALGGAQEREMRAGTENVAGIAGFAAAIAFHGANRSNKSYPARDAFLDALAIPGTQLSVPNRDDALATHAHIRIPGIEAETMLILLDRMEVSASSGAACSSGSLEPSHVLLACGYTPQEAKEGLRFTFGWDTTVEEAKEAARRVNEAAAQIHSTRTKTG